MAHKKGNRKRGSHSKGQLPNFIVSPYENRKFERVRKRHQEMEKYEIC